MSILVTGDQAEPLDPAGYKHHLLLLKSAHCCRPVLYRGVKKFIHTLTLYRDGGGQTMTVYLSGISDGIDSSEIEILADGPQKGATA